MMHDGMQYDPMQGQGHEPLKVSKTVSSVNYYDSVSVSVRMAVCCQWFTGGE